MSEPYVIKVFYLITRANCREFTSEVNYFITTWDIIKQNWVQKALLKENQCKMMINKSVYKETKNDANGTSFRQLKRLRWGWWHCCFPYGIAFIIIFKPNKQQTKIEATRNVFTVNFLFVNIAFSWWQVKREKSKHTN